ncbi:MAG: aminotransferase class V-fold PLP-dependent enzyme [Alphaproteobacteria bacterium]|nr:aminotransferase class V-fold PLP-dependent enzyme [Alphaproteobacteria bacterium]
MTETPWRSLFDLPRDLSYLNAAQIGPAPLRAVEAGKAAYESKARPWTRGIAEDFFDLPEALRAAGARRFNALADCVALVPAASYGLAVAARNISLKPGQEILVLDGQFPSNVYTWRAMAARDGAQVRTVSRSSNQTWTEAVLAAIGSQTGLVACAAVHWIDGGRIDLDAVGAAARDRGAALVLDLTQSLGVMSFDSGAVDPDFAVAACYKWMLGPYATGFLYAAPRHHGGAPLEENWINRAGSQDFAGLIHYQDGYQPGARRYDMGERSSHQLVPAALESLTVLDEIGLAAIEAHCAASTAALAEAAAPFGLSDDTPDRAGHYLSLGLPEGAPGDLAARLKAQGVHVSQRGPRLRVTPHIYTGETDIARFGAALKTALR